MLKPYLSDWTTSAEYGREGLDIAQTKFLEVTDLLLERPNLNSSHLFRADILFDSTGILKTIKQKEEDHGVQHSIMTSNQGGETNPEAQSLCIHGYKLERTVIRRLIPRNAQLDPPLEQSCLIYKDGNEDNAATTDSYLVVYVPHVGPGDKFPWYHPPVKALAYKYEKHKEDGAQLSIHYLPIATSDEPTPTRLHRTFISLLNTLVRLCRSDKPGTSQAPQPSQNGSQSEHTTAIATKSTQAAAPSTRSVLPSKIKDTILPQHIVQDTYARLKHKYAADLINRWIEKTEPSKHVFEDISIAAFLIELWKQMYGNNDHFPGFVDIACGNGVLVYILIQEGYRGCGFDARRRKTWEILGIDQFIEEKVCVPKPFLDALSDEESNDLELATHSGIFPSGTFIISNHADELTPWTPILAALSSPDNPLPFLAIPCCSHALSGGRHRYTIKEVDVAYNEKNLATEASHVNDTKRDSNNEESQPATGDLKALRAQKAKGNTDDKSQYACLTKKVVALAEEIGFDVEMTLMRIPSTRNIGIVGNRRRALDISQRQRQQGNMALNGQLGGNDQASTENGKGTDADIVADAIDVVLQRECAMSGGITGAATIWIERAKKLQGGVGRGKVNFGRKPEIEDNQLEHDNVVAHQD